jgi:hypothetical protein
MWQTLKPANPSCARHPLDIGSRQALNKAKTSMLLVPKESATEKLEQ